MGDATVKIKKSQFCQLPTKKTLFEKIVTARDKVRKREREKERNREREREKDRDGGIEKKIYIKRGRENVT